MNLRQRARVYASVITCCRTHAHATEEEKVAHVLNDLGDDMEEIPWAMIIELILKLIEIFSKK